MKKCFLLILKTGLFLQVLFSQTTEVNKQANDSLMATRKDSIKWAKLEAMAYYPLIKDNPNSKLIDDLTKNGVKFIACGQAMHFFDVNKEGLYPGKSFTYCTNCFIKLHWTGLCIIFS